MWLWLCGDKGFRSRRKLTFLNMYIVATGVWYIHIRVCVNRSAFVGKIGFSLESALWIHQGQVKTSR